MPKRSFDGMDGICVGQQAVYQPQMKNKISERILLQNSSCDRAKEEKKKIETKTLNMLFSAQKKKDLETESPVDSPQPNSKPLSGLQSILSFFPHSSRLSDAVVQSGLAIQGLTDDKVKCSLCTKPKKCQKCRSCGHLICQNCYFPDYSSAETNFTCRQCY